MKRIKCYSKITPEEFTCISKYGYCTHSKTNLNFVNCLILFFIIYLYNPKLQFIIVSLSILIFIILNYEIEGSKSLTKKYMKLYDFPIDNKVEFKENSFMWTFPVRGQSESTEISYNYISYILEIEDFIVLIMCEPTQNSRLIPIKKVDLEIETEDFKQFILKKCRKLEKVRITNPKKMYIILQLCRILYALFIISILFFPEVFA